MKDNFLNRFGKYIKGTITGFDRIIFRGILKPLIFEGGFQNFLFNNNVLNKNFKEFMIDQSKTISNLANEYTYKQIGCKTTYLYSPNVRKEELAHKKQIELGIKTGLIGTWSCLESGSSFRGVYDEKLGYPKITKYRTRCKHIYYYFDHKLYGFMSIRLKTWAPFNIQIALNGREWLRRLLDKNNCGYIKEKNKFLHIDDYSLAQNLLNSQLETDWASLLNSFLPIVFPTMENILGDTEYYWTLSQSEWAKDYIFDSSESLKPIMQDLLHYAFVSDSTQNIFKYMNQSQSGSDYISRVNKYDDGFCFKASVNKNSTKFYSFHNDFRIESTINKPEVYKVNRFKTNSLPGDEKQFLPLIKGIPFIKMRAQVSDTLVNNFVDHISNVTTRTPIDNIFSFGANRIFRNGKSIRALDILGKDKLLLQAISDTIFEVGFISNKLLRKKLGSSSWTKNMNSKKLASKITRHFRILREHGIIKKLCHQNKYHLTDKVRKLTSTLNTILGTSANDLLKLAA